MIQCKDCEFFHRDEETGRITLGCDPFATIKEPSCLDKMQLLRLDALLHLYQRMTSGNERLVTMQEKMMRYVEREMDDIDESESWKYGQDEGNEDETQQPDDLNNNTADDDENGRQDPFSL